MGYNKEYYEEHKESFKKSMEKYRNNNREELNRKQREKYNLLSEEERNARIEKQQAKRNKNIELSRLQYRIDSNKRLLRKYEKKLFDLEMIDTWDSSDYKYSNTLSKKIVHYKNRINELIQEKENMLALESKQLEE